VHANNSKEQALHLLVAEAFQQQAEADGKWNRVTLSQVQLCSYFTATLKFMILEKDLKEGRWQI
jgi:hypothetical protein